MHGSHTIAFLLDLNTLLSLKVVLTRWPPLLSLGFTFQTKRCSMQSTSTCSGTQQRAFDLWLIFASVASYTTSLFGNIKPSRPHFCQITAQQAQTTTPGIPCPTLFEQFMGSFTSCRIMNNKELRDGAYGFIVLVREDYKV